MTRYRDLIQFEPIDSVKHLTEGSDLDQAREDVRTYVISETMRDALAKVLVPNLRSTSRAITKAYVQSPRTGLARHT
jgi:hypothetical protein